MQISVLLLSCLFAALQIPTGESASVCTKMDLLTRQPFTINCPGLLQSHSYKYCCGSFENRYCCKKSQFKAYIPNDYHTVHYRKYGNIGGFMSMMFGILMLICCCSLVSRLKKRQQMNSMPVFSSTAPAPAVHVLNQPPPGSYPVQLPPTMTPYPQPPYFGKPGDSNGYPMPPPPAYTPTATNEPHQQAPSAPEYPPYPSYSNYPSAPQK